MNIELKRRSLKESMKYLVDKLDDGEIDVVAFVHLIRCRLENELDAPDIMRISKTESEQPSCL